MKKAYQIDERKAIDRFHSYLATNPGNIQLVLPLADLAQRMRHGVSQMLFDAERELLMLIIGDEIKWLSREHGMARWGAAPGSVIIHGQKRPRLSPPGLSRRLAHRSRRCPPYRERRQRLPRHQTSSSPLPPKQINPLNRTSRRAFQKGRCRTAR